jgi:hypothetical protein
MDCVTSHAKSWNQLKQKYLLGSKTFGCLPDLKSAMEETVNRVGPTAKGSPN